MGVASSTDGGKRVIYRRKTGKPVLGKLTIGKEVQVHMYECNDPDCGARWQPEQPLRTHASMNQDPRFADYKVRLRKSYRCPKCGGSGKPLRERGGQVVAKTHRPRIYLMESELRELKRRLDPNLPIVPHMEKVTMGDETFERPLGYESYPLKLTLNRAGGKQPIEVVFNDYVVVSPFGDQSSKSMPSNDEMEVLIERATRIGELERERAEIYRQLVDTEGMVEEDRVALKAEIDSLNAELDRLKVVDVSG